MARPGMIRLGPIDSASGTIVEMKAVGIPCRSNSFAIVAPQRVHVPQVAVKMTPSTDEARSSRAISPAKRRALVVLAPLPTNTQ